MKYAFGLLSSIDKFSYTMKGKFLNRGNGGYLRETCSLKRAAWRVNCLVILLSWSSVMSLTSRVSLMCLEPAPHDRQMATAVPGVNDPVAALMV